MRTITKITAASLAILLPTAASAHPAIFHGASLSTGLLHPFTGPDHLLAMISVGLLASQQNRRWLWPLAFMGAMLVGGLLGMSGFALPLIEPTIAASLLVFGLMIATVTVMPAWIGFALIAFFGLFHGNAHGLEAPVGGASLLYGAGLLVSTAALHFIGVMLGLSVQKTSLQHMARAGGVLIALAGGVLMFA